MSNQTNSISEGVVSPIPQISADKWIRVASYVIDVLPTFLVLFVAWIPVAGLMLAGLFLVPYWLLRDVTGASLGKLLLGLKVVARNGHPATIGARVLRNLPIAVGPVFALIPVLGYALVGPVSFIIILIEAIMLLSQGERLGDRLANTTVLRK